MATVQTRDQVWEDFLSIARLFRYYHALADRYRRNRMILRFLLLSAAASGVAAVLDITPSIMQSVASGVVALLIVWDFVADYATKAAILHTVCSDCGELELDWQNLWLDMDNLDLEDAEVQLRNRKLNEKLRVITDRPGYINVRDDHKLNEECEEIAYRIMGERYAA